MQAVRTNNDVEGWHRRLNVQARRGSLPFYMLVQLLHKEADMVELQVQMVSDRRLKRHQRKTYADMQGALFKYWTEYSSGEHTTSKLLNRRNG